MRLDEKALWRTSETPDNAHMALLGRLCKATESLNEDQAKFVSPYHQMISSQDTSFRIVLFREDILYADAFAYFQKTQCMNLTTYEGPHDLLRWDMVKEQAREAREHVCRSLS